MHRNNLLEKLARYQPLEEAERRAQQQVQDFVSAEQDCFKRSLSIGHVTGSAWVLNPQRSSFLLTHHRKLNKWIQLGGHADGESDVLAVALREAREESGIADIRPLSTEIFDIDVHEIPQHKAEPAHLHYDIRFLLQAASDDYQVGEESHDLAWVSPKDLVRLSVEESVRRMVRKWQKLI